MLNGTNRMSEDGSAVVVPAGVEHNVVNTSTDEPLKLYTLYSPPEHPDGTVHHTKEECARRGAPLTADWFSLCGWAADSDIGTPLSEGVLSERRTQQWV